MRVQEFLGALRFKGCLPADDNTAQHQCISSPLGPNRVYSRFGKGGTVRLPPDGAQAGSHEEEASQLQSLQMQEAVDTILQEIGEDTFRQVWA